MVEQVQLPMGHTWSSIANNVDLQLWTFNKGIGRKNSELEKWEMAHRFSIFLECLTSHLNELSMILQGENQLICACFKL